VERVAVFSLEVSMKYLWTALLVFLPAPACAQSWNCPTCFTNGGGSVAFSNGFSNGFSGFNGLQPQQFGFQQQFAVSGGCQGGFQAPQAFFQPQFIPQYQPAVTLPQFVQPQYLQAPQFYQAPQLYGGPGWGPGFGRRFSIGVNAGLNIERRWR
jgi:hypothetical protein